MKSIYRFLGTARNQTSGFSRVLTLLIMLPIAVFRRGVKPGLLGVATMLTFACSLLATEANASHLRYGNVTWSRVDASTRTVTIQATLSLRKSYGLAGFNTATVGSVVTTDVPLYISYGGSNQVLSYQIPITVTAVNNTEDWLVGTYTTTITIPGSEDNFRAFMNVCCRLSGMGNNGDGTFNVEAIGDLSSASLGSPVSTLPPIVNLAAGLAAANFTVPASDPGGLPLTYRLATATEMGDIAATQPAGLSINANTGQVTWSTVGRAIGSKHNAVLVITNSAGAKIMVDVLLNIVGVSNPPAFDYTVTPANGHVYIVPQGTSLNFNIEATDPDAGSIVSLSAVGLPPSSSFSPTAGNPANGTFSWIAPTGSASTHVMTFTATDDVGVQTNTSVTVNVVLGPDFVSPTPIVDRFVLTGVAINDVIQAQSSEPGVTTQMFSASLPSGATLTQTLPTALAATATLNISWTPSPSNWGINNFQFVAKDQVGQSRTHIYKVLVNTPPVFTSVPVTQAIVGQLYTYNVIVNDPDLAHGDVLDFVHIPAVLPSWLTLTDNNDGTATISGTPAVGDVGTSSVVLTASDIHHHESPLVKQTFNLSVVGSTITASSAITIPGNVYGTVGTPGSFTVSGTGLVDDITIAAVAGLEFSTTSATSGFATTATVPYGTGTVTDVPVWVRIAAGTAVPGITAGSIEVSSAGATSQNVAYGAVEVTPAPLTFTTKNYAKCYTEDISTTLNDPTSTNDLVDFTGTLYGSDAITALTLSTTPANALAANAVEGDYALAAGGATGSGLNNYTITYTNSGILTVHQQPTPGTSAGDHLNETTDPGVCTKTLSYTIAANSGGTPITDYKIVYTDAAGSTTVNDPTAAALQTHTFAKGSTTVTVFANNSCGENQVDAFTVMVKDMEKPVVSMPFTDTVLNVGTGIDCTVKMPDYRPYVILNDNCTTPGNYTIQQLFPNNVDEDVIGYGGSRTVQILVTDLDGNSDTVSFDLHLVDTTSPTAIARNITVNLDPLTGVASITPADIDNNSNDNCSPVTLAIDRSSFTCADLNLPSGANTVILTVTDASGNVSTAAATVTVKDITAPVIAGTVPQQRFAKNAQCTNILGDFTYLVNGSAAALTATDDCNGALVVTQSPAATTIYGGSINQTTVTLTVKDASGNAATYSFPVYFDDSTKPSFVNFPSNIVVSADATACGTNVPWTVPTGADNCSPGRGVTTVSQVSATQPAPAPGSFFAVGTHTITYKAVDAKGNDSVRSFTITVVDDTDPIITAPPAVVLSTDAGSCEATNVSLGMPTTSDNCGIATVTNDATSTVFPKGTTTVTWTAIDNNGNISTATQTVTVNDTEMPTITAPVAVTVNTDAGQCEATNVTLGIPAISDNCTGATYSNDAPAAFPKGNTIVTWTVTDAAGNSATATQVVIVNDNEIPTITAPVAVTVNTDAGQCEATNVTLGTPAISDNCTGATYSNDAPAAFPKGNTIVTWTVTDAAGNSATATQVVIVNDNEIPTITAPVAVTVNTDAGQCEATNVTLGIPAISDNCTGATYSNDAPAAFPKGNTIVTWTVTDAAGNSATATQVVTVNDNEIPTITAPVTVTVNTDAGQCEATNVTLGTPAISDNCTGATYSNDAPAAFPKGNTTVTWTVTDAAGNSATATQVVTVNDTEMPTITAPVAVTVNTDAGQCEATNVALGMAAFSDNCPGSSVSNDAPAVFPKGNTTVTWTVTDAAGNIVTAAQVVTVEDNEAPVAAFSTTALSINVNQASCQATITNAQLSVTATDNCPSAIAGVSFDGGNTYGPVADLYTHSFGTGATTVMLKVEDESGNISNATTVVTVNNPLAGRIEGTATVSQNALITSNVRFVGSGGKAPYTFTYTKNDGATITTHSITTGNGVNDSMVTVPQSNATVGTFAYELLGTTDANGHCAGTISATGHTAVITVTAGYPVDLEPSIFMLAGTFTPSIESRNFTVFVKNNGNVPSGASVVMDIPNPINGGVIQLTTGSQAAGWQLFYQNGNYILGNTNMVIAPGDNRSVSLTLKVPGNASSGNRTLSVKLRDNTAGDANNGNNESNTPINKIN